MVLSGVCPMDDISWTDLNPAEQHAIAALGAGMPVGLCDAAAVRRLKRVGLLSSSHLTRKAGRLRKAAILQNLTNIQPLSRRLKSVQYARWAIQQLREVRSQDHGKEIHIEHYQQQKKEIEGRPQKSAVNRQVRP